jgi:PERQ amino acid-rich with GYF domain-containing protein
MLVRNGTSEVVPPYSTAKPSFFMRACATDTAPGAHTTSDQLPDANTFIHRARRPNGATQTFRRTSNAVNRYSKSQLLDLYRLQQSTDDGLQDDLQNLYIGNWQPNGQNGAPAAGWGRNDASREQPSGPDVCWDDDGAYEPLALTEMDNEEKEVCTSRS